MGWRACRRAVQPRGAGDPLAAQDSNDRGQIAGTVAVTPGGNSHAVLLLPA